MVFELWAFEKLSKKRQFLILFTLIWRARAARQPTSYLDFIYGVCARARALASQHPREREPKRVREGERLGQRGERRRRERGEGGA